MSDTLIIYPNETRTGICLIIPTNELSIEEVARKDVPPGTPYLFVTRDQLPPDHEYFNAWTADFSSPDGHGIGHEAWFAEQENNQ